MFCLTLNKRLSNPLISNQGNNQTMKRCSSSPKSWIDILKIHSTSRINAQGEAAEAISGCFRRNPDQPTTTPSAPTSSFTHCSCFSWAARCLLTQRGSMYQLMVPELLNYIHTIPRNTGSRAEGQDRSSHSTL